ncbi:MAG: HAD family hydrolase [Chloroflexota bacterium]|jgi:phosphoglycolate phosphatase|nr:HAD family hydrolase [Chloroflexota bacterium]
MAGSAGIGPFTAVLFDLDGTLLDSFGSIADLTDAALVEAGHPPCDRDILRRLIGLPLEVVFRQVWPFEPTDDDVTRAMATYRATQLANASPTFFPGAADLVTSLRAAGKQLAIVTTKGTPAARRALADGALIDSFGAVVGGDIVPHLKPHPAPAEMALRELGVAARDAVVVGDTTHDIHMGNSAGCRSVGVTWGAHDAATLHGAGAAAVATEMAGLRAILLGDR